MRASSGSSRRSDPNRSAANGCAERTGSKRSWIDGAQLAALVGIGIVIRLTLIQTPGYHDDVALFIGWYKSVASQPLSQVYANTPGLNYPPMCLLMYKLEALVVHGFVRGVPSDTTLRAIVKLPPILFDGAAALLAYWFVRPQAGHRLGLFAAAALALNPAIVYDSAYWGQNDAIPAFFAIAALLLLTSNATVVAWLAITCGVLFKPHVAVLVPLMLLYPFTATLRERTRRLTATVAGVGAALVFIEIVAFTFFGHSNALAVNRHFIATFIADANVFPYTSLNAFNAWALLGTFFLDDRIKIFGLSRHVLGVAAFASIAAPLYWRYLKAGGTVRIVETGTLVLLAFFLVLTEMHERYMYFAVFFCAFLVFEERYRIALLALSTTLLLNMEYGVTFMFLDDAKATVVNRFAFAPSLVFVCASANLVTFIALVAGKKFAKSAGLLGIPPAPSFDRRLTGTVDGLG